MLETMGFTSLTDLTFSKISCVGATNPPGESIRMTMAEISLRFLNFSNFEFICSEAIIGPEIFITPTFFPGESIEELFDMAPNLNTSTKRKKDPNPHHNQ